MKDTFDQYSDDSAIDAGPLAHLDLDDEKFRGSVFSLKQVIMS